MTKRCHQPTSTLQLDESSRGRRGVVKARLCFSSKPKDVGTKTLPLTSQGIWESAGSLEYLCYGDLSVAEVCVVVEDFRRVEQVEHGLGLQGWHLRNCL